MAARILFFFLLLLAGFAQADEPLQRYPNPPIGQTRPSDEPLQIPDYAQVPVAQSAPTTLIDKTADQAVYDLSRLSGIGFRLQKVIFQGHRVFSTEQLQQVVQPFIGQQVSLADLEEIRFRLTKIYVDAGYINSGVLLPAQQISEGVVHFQIIEGRIAHIEIEGLDGLEADYVAKRLFGKDEVFNVHELQKRYALLLQDPLIAQLNSEVQPLDEMGQARMRIRLKRHRPYDLFLGVDNFHPPSSGEKQAWLAANIRNISGYGDLLSASINLTEGNDNYYLRYEHPLSADDLRLYLAYTDSESSVIEENLLDADIRSQYQTWKLGLSYPLIRELEQSLRLELELNHRRSQTFVLGVGMPFSEGVAPDGRAKTTVLRFSQQYTRKKTDDAWVARSTFNIGLSLFDATVNAGSIADSRFFSWLGQFQYAHRLEPYQSQWTFRSRLQLSNQRLLSLEQIAIGGPESVRGYRSNEYIRDNGFDLSLQYQHPLWGNPFNHRQFSLQLAFFIDAGSAWNHRQHRDSRLLSSAGVGLIFDYRGVQGELYWAYPFRHIPYTNEPYWQDRGVSFRLSYHY